MPLTHLTGSPYRRFAMPISESIRTCAICGADISHKRAKANTCSRECSLIASSKKQYVKIKAEAERRKLEKLRTAKPRRCIVCNAEFMSNTNQQKYCSTKCNLIAQKQKQEEQHKQLLEIGSVKKCNRCHLEKTISEFYAGVLFCKECGKNHSREYMRKRLQEDADFKQRQKQSAKLSVKNNPEPRRAREQEYRLRKRKHNAHINAWIKYNNSIKVKHDAHVSDFRQLIKQSPEWCERFYTDLGQPWRNPHLTDAQKYTSQYRNDPAFRLGEINRATWRKDVLAARDDGTQNFLLLLKERKTCPYCLTPITKENAVADHMNPLKLGGANSQHNLTICCRECNQRKSGKPFTDWLAMLPEHRRRPALRWYQRKQQHPPAQSSLTLVF